MASDISSLLMSAFVSLRVDLLGLRLRWRAPRSFRLGDLSGDRSPFVDLALHELGELRGGQQFGHDRFLLQPLARTVARQRLDDFAVEFVDNIARDSGRS